MAQNAMILRLDEARLPARLLNELNNARQALQPTDPRHLAVLLDETMRLWKLPEHWETTAKFYLEALEDLPADLAETALKRARLTCTFTPRPAEIRALVVDQLSQRRRALLDWERTARNYEPPQREDPVMRAKLQKMFKDLGEKLKTPEAGKSEEQLDQITTATPT